MVLYAADGAARSSRTETNDAPAAPPVQEGARRGRAGGRREEDPHRGRRGRCSTSPNGTWATATIPDWPSTTTSPTLDHIEVGSHRDPLTREFTARSRDDAVRDNNLVTIGSQSRYKTSYCCGRVVDGPLTDRGVWWPFPAIPRHRRRSWPHSRLSGPGRRGRREPSRSSRDGDPSGGPPSAPWVSSTPPPAWATPPATAAEQGRSPTATDASSG